jgi:hypothetical protein
MSEIPNWSRRAAIQRVATGFVAATLTNSSAEAEREPKNKQSNHLAEELKEAGMQVCCPKNGIISSISAKDGHINETDLICQVAFDEETLAVERLKVSQSLLEIDARVLSAEQVQIRRRVVEIAGEITNAYVQYAQAKYDKDRTENELGIASDLVLLQSATALAKANAENEKARISLENFDFNLQLMKERHELVKAQMPVEIRFLADKIKQLEIHSPKAGELRLLVGIGSFVSLGQPIAEVF